MRFTGLQLSCGGLFALFAVCFDSLAASDNYDVIAW
jgi:hypothetical protein